MYRTTKMFTFDAAHYLPGHGKCDRMHGHRWRVEITVAAETLNPQGMVMDFHDFAPLKNYVEQRLDHQVVNDTITVPTAENIARHLYEWTRANWQNVERVRVWESPTAWGEYGR